MTRVTGSPGVQAPPAKRDSTAGRLRLPAVKRAGADAADLRIALVIAATTVVTTLLARLPYLQHFAPRGEDMGVLVNASRFGQPSVRRWLTAGTRDYFTNYPELNLPGDFVRPVVDGSVFINSLIAPSVSSPLMLTVNYLGHALCAALVYLVGRKILELSRSAALLAAVLFAGTASVTPVLAFVAYRGDMLVALFTLGALLVVGRARGWRGVAAAVLIVLALFSKEGGVAAPLAVAVLLAYRAAEDDRWAAWTRRLKTYIPALLVVGVPSALYVAALLTRDLGGNHVLRDLTSTTLFGIPTAALNPLRFGLTAFFPVDPDVLKAILGVSGPADSVHPVEALRAPLAFAVTILAWTALVVALSRAGSRRRMLLGVGLALAASAVPIALKADPRYMYLSQSLMLPLLMLALIETRQRFAALRSPVLTRAVVVTLLAVGPVYLIGETLSSNARLIRENEITAELTRQFASEAQRADVDAVYAVNVPNYASPGLPLLQHAAQRAGRSDLTLRVANTLNRWDRTTVGDEGVAVTRDGAALRVEVTIGNDEVFFSYLTPEDAARLGVPGVIEYDSIADFRQTRPGKSTVAANKLGFTIPHGDHVALVGVDPSSDGVYVYRSTDPIPRWRPATK